jgi:hypothetical protein
MAGRDRKSDTGLTQNPTFQKTQLLPDAARCADRVAPTPVAAGVYPRITLITRIAARPTRAALRAAPC